MNSGKNLNLNLKTIQNSKCQREPGFIDALEIKNAKSVALPGGIFQYFGGTEKLNVNDLGISILLADRFEGADKLKVLHISKNNITIVPSRVFVNLTNVKNMQLLDNQIEIIEDNAFDGMMNLKELDLDDNLIKSIGHSTFAGAPKIRMLCLASNKIETIEDGAFNLPNLKFLVLDGNQLTTLSDCFLIGAVKLVGFLAGYNKITHIGKAFRHSDKLEYLSLDGNPIEDAKLSTLATFANLRNLSLSNISLSLPEKIPERNPESKLTTIWLNSNNLSNPDILKHLSVFGQLENIYLENNKFPGINEEFMKIEYPRLKLLSLWNNKPSLCEWMLKNEIYLENIKVLSTTPRGDKCEYNRSVIQRIPKNA